MSQPTILLNSVTYAIRAQKLLEQRGIRSNIQKIPGGKKIKGCAYGLVIKGNVSAAAQILSAADIRIVDIVEV